MTKEVFLAELADKLSWLPQTDTEERLAFYAEAIDDRIDDGLTEEKAVAALGKIDDIVSQIASDVPIKTLVRGRKEHSQKRSGSHIALIALGFPLWSALLVAFAAVLLSLYIVIWSAVLCEWTADLAFAMTTLGGIAGAVNCLIKGSPAAAAAFIGVSLICAGISILLFLGCKALTKAVGRFTGAIYSKIKISFFTKGRR